MSDGPKVYLGKETWLLLKARIKRNVSHARKKIRWEKLVSRANFGSFDESIKWRIAERRRVFNSNEMNR